MLPILLALAVAPAVLQEESFRLDNGLEVVVVPVADAPIVAVVLGYRAGVYTDPEGRCGTAHVLEHLLVHGATPSFPAPFATLTAGGPLGMPFVDVNAETMADATYFYALRPPAKLAETLQLFGEKLQGFAITQELLDAERPKALQEIDGVAAMLESRPQLRQQMENLARYPKAGIADHVGALTIGELEAYRRAHYRPDRAHLIVMGACDPIATCKRIEAQFGKAAAPTAPGAADPAAPAVPEQAIVEQAVGGATVAESAALRIAASAWQVDLRRTGRAYVEWVPDGRLRAVLFGSDPAPIRAARGRLQEPQTAAALRGARTAVTQRMRMLERTASPAQLQPGGDPVAYTRGLAQIAINRTLFEIGGGAAFLEAAGAVTAEDVVAVAKKYLTAASEAVRTVPVASKANQ